MPAVVVYGSMSHLVLTLLYKFRNQGANSHHAHAQQSCATCVRRPWACTSDVDSLLHTHSSSLLLCSPPPPRRLPTTMERDDDGAVVADYKAPRSAAPAAQAGALHERATVREQAPRVPRGQALPQAAPPAARAARATGQPHARCTGRNHTGKRRPRVRAQAALAERRAARPGGRGGLLRGRRARRRGGHRRRRPLRARPQPAPPVRRAHLHGRLAVAHLRCRNGRAARQRAGAPPVSRQAADRPAHDHLPRAVRDGGRAARRHPQPDATVAPHLWLHDDHPLRDRRPDAAQGRFAMLRKERRASSTPRPSRPSGAG